MIRKFEFVTKTQFHSRKKIIIFCQGLNKYFSFKKRTGRSDQKKYKEKRYFILFLIINNKIRL